MEAPTWLWSCPSLGRASVCRVRRSQCKHVRNAASAILKTETEREDFNGPNLKLVCFDLPSVLCPPTNVTTVHTCAPDPVPVAWTPSDSAKIYTAVAVSGRGHRSECTTNQTSCSLPGLQCGEVYTVGVSGTDDNCTSQLSDTVSLNTGNIMA